MEKLKEEYLDYFDKNIKRHSFEEDDEDSEEDEYETENEGDY